MGRDEGRREENFFWRGELFFRDAFSKRKSLIP
jgi:hypothetical protein